MPLYLFYFLISYLFLLFCLYNCQYPVFSLSLPPAATFLQVWPHTGSCTVNLSQAEKGDLPCSLPVSTDVKVNLGDLNKRLHNPGTLLPPCQLHRLEEASCLQWGWGFFFRANYILTTENIYTGFKKGLWITWMDNISFKVKQLWNLLSQIRKGVYPPLSMGHDMIHRWQVMRAVRCGLRLPNLSPTGKHWFMSSN